MLKNKTGGEKISVFVLVSIFLIFNGTFSSSFAGNLLKCANFEELDTLSQCWTHLSWGSSDISAQIVSGGYQNSNSLMMLNNDPRLITQYVRQIVGSLEPGVYGLSVLYKASPGCQAKAYIRNTGETAIGQCAVRDGTGSWNELNFNFALMDEYSDQEWQVFLYGGMPPNINEPIYYDNVFFEKLNLSQIEEVNLRFWTKWVYGFTDGLPTLQWSPSRVSISSAALDPNIRGRYALILKGSRTTVDNYNFIVPIKPETKYKVSVALKYKNRKSYNYLESEPPFPLAYSNENSLILKSTKGIWNGQYDIKVYDDYLGSSYRVGLVQPVINDSIYVEEANRDWFSEQAYFKSGPNANNLTVQIELKCFDGELYVDDLTVEEVYTHIEDKMLRIPINYEYEGMKIIDTTLPYIKTNAAEFIFTSRSIQLVKDSEFLGDLSFQSDFLASLTVDTKTSGLIILKNDNITISLGADSSMIVRLEKDTNVVVTGGLKPPKYYNFDAGCIFVSDYQKGFLFSPIFPELNIKTMGRLLSPPFNNADDNILDYRYSDSDIDIIGLKCWDSRPNFKSPYWKTTYRFKTGDGFAASVFPPKDFNYSKYAKQRMHAGLGLNLNIFPQGDYSYLLTKFKERFNILLLWAGSYNLSSSHPNSPTVYYVNSAGIPVRPDESDALAVKFVHDNVAGPFKASQPSALKKLVSQAHEMGLKVIVYMSPAFFYTSDVNTLLNNLNENITDYNIDGVYFDGLSPCRPLQNLELVRKTRAILKDKYYVQHDSWINALIYKSDHFRVPFYDAYADLIYTGENLRKDYTGNPNTWDLACPADPNAWGLLYCSRNLSNTPTVLIGTYRPIDYSDGKAGLDLTLSPQTQMDYQLKYQGIFRVWPFTPDCYFYDLLYDKKLFFDSSYWWNVFDDMCLNFTADDGVADIGESIYTVQKDCAPPKADAVLIKYGDTREYLSNDSLSQWFIDGRSLYRFHYNFDGDIATDDSDNKMNPSQFLGILSMADSNYAVRDANYTAPYSSHVDGRKTFYFDGFMKLFAEHNEKLCLMDDSNRVTTFSSFAVVKRDSNNPDRECIFNLNKSSHHFSYGFYKNKFYIRVLDSDNKLQEHYSSAKIDQNWHTVGMVYDGSNLAIYVDGVVVKVIKVNLFPFPVVDTFVIGSSAISSPGFKGWIDDLFITDRPLTDRQILEYHQNVGKTLTVTNASKVDCILIKDGRKYTAAGSLMWAFSIKNSSGGISAGFDASGNLLLRGTIVENTLPPASDSDEFRVQDFNNSDVAIIDSISGNMYIKGSVYQKQTIFLPAGNFNFTICDNNRSVIAYIDKSGNLYLSGKLYENADI